MNEVYDDMIIHAAAIGDCEDQTRWRSWVNALRMPKGGTHQSAFDGALKSVGWKPTVRLVHVMMRDARFTGSSIRALDVPEFADSIEARIRAKLTEFRSQL